MIKLRWILISAFLGGGAFAAPGSEWVPPTPSSAPLAALPADIDDEESQLQLRLQSLKRESKQRTALTVARGRAYVRLARAGLLPLSDGFDALADHASRLERLRRALGRDLERQEQIVAQRLEIARALAALDQLRPADRQAMDRARSAIAAAEEREAAFQRAFNSNWQPRSRTAVYGARVAPGYRARPGGGFRSQRGRLPFPVAGRAEIQTVRSPTGQGKALVMASAPGAVVRSVHPGRVAFADDYPGLGNTVILDHGDQLYTVSAHLGGIRVRAGDELASGQPVGTVGTYEQQPALLFEVRSGQTTLDTPKWFGL